jgi:hypothetical protein
MGVSQRVEECLVEVAQQRQAEQSTQTQLLWEQEAETWWHKVDHLLYLPVLGLTRPRDLYYYQGQGLQVLCGFTYKYLTVEHFLGRLTRLRVGWPLATVLADSYSQAWYPGYEALFIFADWHIKPHWTKHPAHSGAVTMWGRVMPGTKQLLINGPEGHLLGGWNEAIDSHLSRKLVDLELKLADSLQRPIAYTICDSEGGGLPTGQRYAEANRYYLSLLPHQNYKLTDFELLDEWQRVTDDPAREAVSVRWRDPVRNATEVRDLVVMRRLNDTDPTRVYAGRLPPGLVAAEVPATFRQRWRCQERIIRQLVNGANLNANFGYSYQQVPNRTQQRRWEKAQDKVETSQQRLAQYDEALHNLQRQLASLRLSYHRERQTLETTLADRQEEFITRHQTGQALRRCQQRLAKHYRDLDKLTVRYRRRRKILLDKARQQRLRQVEVKTELAARQAVRDAIDTESLCRERNLEKDQIMLNLQLLLANLHDWSREHYLAPLWQRLELETATNLIYRKPGWVKWGEQEIEVVLESYRYPEHQQAMEESCRRFNAAGILWRDGRKLYIRVAPT